MAANLAAFPGFSPRQRDRLYMLLAPLRARLAEAEASGAA